MNEHRQFDHPTPTIIQIVLQVLTMQRQEIKVSKGVYTASNQRLSLSRDERIDNIATRTSLLSQVILLWKILKITSLLYFHENDAIDPKDSLISIMKQHS